MNEIYVNLNVISPLFENHTDISEISRLQRLNMNGEMALRFRSIVISTRLFLINR